MIAKVTSYNANYTDNYGYKMNDEEIKQMNYFKSIIRRLEVKERSKANSHDLATDDTSLLPNRSHNALDRYVFNGPIGGYTN